MPNTQVKTVIVGLFLIASITAAPSQATDPAPANQAAITNPDVGVPVFPYDIDDRSYDIVGEVTAKVGKTTIFSKEASQQKIYRELWERAKKMGADAVVNARYGDSHVTAFNWGSTTATGTAIRFKDNPLINPTSPKPDESGSQSK